jgi:hypothetical protein
MDIAFKSLYIKFTYKNNIQLMTSETDTDFLTRNNGSCKTTNSCFIMCLGNYLIMYGLNKDSMFYAHLKPRQSWGL